MCEFLSTIWRDLGGRAETLERVDVTGEGYWPSVFAVSDLAAAAIGAVGAAVAELVETRFGIAPRVNVDRRLSSLWFAWSMRPLGWAMPSPWDPIAGDYPTADGWIRLHTNAPHHREAALAVLGVPANKDDVARAVSSWKAEALETAVVARGGCAAEMRSLHAWREHPQGLHVAAEPLVAVRVTDDAAIAGSVVSAWKPTVERPLRGLRVLDLTRVLAGPVATRFLAGFGADVLRIDSPTWDEPAVVPDVTLGKRCARLDLRDAAGRERLHDLLRHADVLVHGYRADALERLGLGVDARRAIRPGLVDVCLDAYGWTGPWRNRRGFDSLVQMSTGIADSGMRQLGKSRPTPLPVQALDHGAGYLMAAAVIRGLTARDARHRGFEARVSLARTAELLTRGAAGRIDTSLTAEEGDWAPAIEQSVFGSSQRLRPPVQAGEAVMQWDRPAAALGSSPPEW
jgi:crotonobetainyl-CoA:carnitine CoA-transferase CaiB-like acyl-CoA transferase